MAGRVEVFNSGMSEDEIIAKVKQSLLEKNDFVNTIKGNANMDKYFIPPGDPAFHLEIPL